MKIRLYLDNCSFNRPYDDLSLLKNYLEAEAKTYIQKEIIQKNIKPKDSLHLACAIEAECNYFITTDDRILNKSVEKIVIIDPIDFVKMAEVYK